MGAQGWLAMAVMGFALGILGSAVSIARVRARANDKDERGANERRAEAGAETGDGAASGEAEVAIPRLAAQGVTGRAAAEATNDAADAHATGDDGETVVPAREAQDAPAADGRDLPAAGTADERGIRHFAPASLELELRQALADTGDAGGDGSHDEGPDDGHGKAASGRATRSVAQARPDLGALATAPASGHDPTGANDEDAPAAEPLTVDLDELPSALFASADPIAELKRLVRRVHAAERRARDGKGLEPTAVATYLARGLDEAGLAALSTSKLDLAVVFPSRSKTFYLRVGTPLVPWRDVVRVLAVESALNRALFAWEHLSHKSAPEDHAIEDCYRFNQALATSITAQLGTDPIRHASMSDVLGEWGARQAISAGIESFRLPLRLTAQFRVNLMGGDAAIVANHLPWRAFPASVWSNELGRVVPATREMRERAATDYAMRVALLLASHAFRCSRRLCHVFVALDLDTPERHECLLWGDVSREALAELDLTGTFDAQEACRSLGFSFRVENGALQPIPDGFSLDSERFCPRGRYDSVDLSNRLLPRFESRLLGATRVRDLAINEDAHRAQVAQVAALALGPSCERNVREVLSLTEDDRDPTVREAGVRTAEALISGSIPEDDPLAFADVFVSGDELSRACERALDSLRDHDAPAAVEILTDALAPVDALDAYRDAGDDTWREFSSYVGRTLYNRLLAKPQERPHLVPDSYYNAQLLMASALLAEGRAEQALGFARRARDLDPLNIAGTLRVVRCLEVLDRRREAAKALKEQLELAFDPEGIGTCYYRLAFMEWRLGELDLADACYQKAAVSRSSCSAAAMLELHTMRAVSGSEGVDSADVNDTLEAAGIPLAPTDRIVEVLLEAAQAATDAEVFPVARSFASLLGALSGDDVMRGVVNSMEREPDR